MSEICYGQVGVHRKNPLLKKDGFLDDEYDHDCPDGFESSRRNYSNCQYWSGMKDEEPKHFHLTGFSRSRG